MLFSSHVMVYMQTIKTKHWICDIIYTYRYFYIHPKTYWGYF